MVRDGPPHLVFFWMASVTIRVGTRKILFSPLSRGPVSIPPVGILPIASSETGYQLQRSPDRSALLAGQAGVSNALFCCLPA